MTRVKGGTVAINSRVLGEKKRYQYDNEDKGRKRNGSLVVDEYLAVLTLQGGNQTTHNEDAVIYANAENDAGHNDVDEVELQSKQRHRSLYDVPT